MVDDTVFLVVLIALIVVIVTFVAFLIFLKRVMPSPLLMKVVSTLHSTLFGYETALIELIGPRGYKTHVFPKIVETINNLKSENELISDVTEARTPKEAMEKWLEVLELAKIAKGARLVDKGNDEYVIEIPDCSMCNPIHGIMGSAKGICPNALVVAAASAVVESDKVPVIDYSKLTPTGSYTTIKFKNSSE